MGEKVISFAAHMCMPSITDGGALIGKKSDDPKLRNYKAFLVGHKKVPAPSLHSKMELFESPCRKEADLSSLVELSDAACLRCVCKHLSSNQAGLKVNFSA
jgi:hypothetical protein